MKTIFLLLMASWLTLPTALSSTFSGVERTQPANAGVSIKPGVKAQLEPQVMRQIKSSSPRSGRQGVFSLSRTAARIRGLGIAGTLHPGLYADARVRGLETGLHLQAEFLGITNRLTAEGQPTLINWITEAGGSVTRDRAGRIIAVDLRASWVTDSDLPQLAALPHLTRLDLSQTRITDLGLQQLKAAPGIVELNLYYAEQITDEGMAAVKSWKKLKRINLRGTKVTDTTLEHLANVTTLEAIDVGFAQITDVGLDRLAPLVNLKELVISGNKLTDMGLQALRQMTGLTHLTLGGSQRTDSGLWTISLTEQGLDAITTLKDLRELRLDGMPVTVRWLEKLKTLDKLERLSLQGCKRVGDDAVPLLASLSALRVVDLKGTAVTEQGLAELRRAKPKTQLLY